MNKSNPKSRRLSLQLFATILLLIIGCGLLIAGFVVPPPGEIHNSVLIAFGEILTFIGTVLGIDYKYKDKLHHHSNGSNSDGTTDNP